LLAALEDADVELFMQPETRWYRVDDEEAGVHQFLVQDPDGYLIRFQSSIGRRPAVPVADASSGAGARIRPLRASR
jgi:hypothetical protein